MSRLRLRYFEVFLALMQTGSTQAAAHMLNTTQPSISKALGALERQLGLLLFVRTNSGLRPTSEGYTLFAEANRIHEEIQSFERVAGELKEGKAVHLNLQVTAALAHSIVPRAVAIYKQRWRDTKLSISVAHTDALVANVRNHVADMGLVLANDEEEIGPVRKLWSSPMVCIFPAGHRLAALEEVRPSDLKDEPLIVYRASQGQGRMVEKAFQAEDVSGQVEIRLNQSSSICMVVNEGYGVAVVDRLTVLSGNFPRTVFRPFAPACIVNVGLVVSEQRPLSLQAERFRAVVQECLDALEP